MPRAEVKRDPSSLDATGSELIYAAGMARPVRPPEPPAPWIVLGCFVTAIGSGLLLEADGGLVLLGVAVLTLGAAVTQIALIAAGVSWGMRRHDSLRGR